MIMQRYNEWRYKVNITKREKITQKCRKYSEKCKEYEQQVLELETESGQEKAWQEKYIKSKAYMAIGLGAIMLVLTFLLTYICEISKWDDKWKALCSATITGLNSVFSIVIGIGISTLVLDFFSYVKYTRNRIKEIMLDKKYIETLSDKEKRRMIESAEQSLYFRNGEVLDTSLYANIKELIVPLIEDNYYKQYKVHIDCDVDEEKKVIIKKVHKIMDIMCIREEEFKIPFSTYMLKIDGIEDKELYVIRECICNGQNVTDEVNSKVVSKDIDDMENIMQVKFSVDYVFKLKKGLNRIEIRTDTIVPIYDNTYAHTITIPCQRYSINFSIHSPNHEVLGYGFAFDDEKHKNSIDKIIYKDKYDDCFKIRFENWTLPGDGVVFLINKKVSDK